MQKNYRCLRFERMSTTTLKSLHAYLSNKYITVLSNTQAVLLTNFIWNGRKLIPIPNKINRRADFVEHNNCLLLFMFRYIHLLDDNPDSQRIRRSGEIVIIKKK